MRATLKLCVVRIYSNSGKVIGAGCLVSQKHILTCAHVVADALGIPRNTSEMPDALITLDFPLIAAAQCLKAKVVFWLPVNPDVQEEDIAGLELENYCPQKAQPAKLIASEDLCEHTFKVFGFPSGQPNGVWASGVLKGLSADAWVQLEDIKQPGYRLEPGFSGAPIWDEKSKGVVGIAVAADMRRPETKVGFIIPASILSKTWNEVNVVSQAFIQELEKKLLNYSFRANTLIFDSYSRSGEIDESCKEYLEIARNQLGLSYSDTAFRENELLLLCRNAFKDLKYNIKKSEQLVIDFFVKNSLEEYPELKSNNIRSTLNSLQVALGLSEESADKTFSHSLSNYANKFLTLDNIKAFFLFKEALNRNYNNISAHIGIGKIFFLNLQYLKAIKYFYKAEKIVNSIDHGKYYGNVEDIKTIQQLIQKTKIIYYQHILIKILRIIFPVPITRITNKLILCIKKFLTNKTRRK